MEIVCHHKANKISFHHGLIKYQSNFIVPGFFNIGPRKDEPGLLKYARFMSARHMRCNHVKELVRDVIESEIRVAAALMTMKEINNGIKQFKQQVFVEVQLELDHSDFRFTMPMSNSLWKFPSMM